MRIISVSLTCRMLWVEVKMSRVMMKQSCYLFPSCLFCLTQSKCQLIDSVAFWANPQDSLFHGVVPRTLVQRWVFSRLQTYLLGCVCYKYPEICSTTLYFALENYLHRIGKVKVWFIDSRTMVLRMKCCFKSTETVGLLGTGAQDVHLDFHTAPDLWPMGAWNF